MKSPDFPGTVNRAAVEITIRNRQRRFDELEQFYELAKHQHPVSTADRFINQFETRRQFGGRLLPFVFARQQAKVAARLPEPQQRRQHREPPL